jgi:hypothetical protein
MKSVKVFFLWVLLLPLTISAQKIINLYPGTIPNPKVSRVEGETTLPANGMFTHVTKPTLEIYHPKKEKASAAVIICPALIK